MPLPQILASSVDHRDHILLHTMLTVTDVYAAILCDDNSMSEPFLPRKYTSAPQIWRCSLLLGLVIGFFVQLSTLGAYLIITVVTFNARTATTDIASFPSATAYYGATVVLSALISTMAVSVFVYVRQLMVMVGGRANQQLLLLAEASFLLGCLTSISCMHLASLALLRHNEPLLKFPLWNLAFNAFLVATWGWITWNIYGVAARIEANKKSAEDDNKNDDTLPLLTV